MLNDKYFDVTITFIIVILKSHKLLRKRYLHTEVVQKQVHTISVIFTRVRFAKTDGIFTSFSCPSFGTFTDKTSNTVLALSSIQAWTRSAVIYVSLTEVSNEAFATFTLEFVVQIKALGSSSRVTFIGGTFINSGLTSETCVTWSTVADKACFFICK